MTSDAAMERDDGRELPLAYPQRQAPKTSPIKQLLAVIYRQRVPLALAFGTVFLLGVIVTVFMPREYTSTASVQFEQQAPRVIAVDDIDPQPAVQDSERFLQTQLDRVRSRQVAQRVSEQLDIANDVRIQEALAIDGTSEEEFGEAVFLALQDGLLAQLGVNTRIAQISFSSRDPVVSAQIANGFARELIETNLSDKAETSTRALAYLQEQLDDAKGKLEDSERRMLTYARNANLTRTVSTGAAADPDQGGSLRARRLASLTDSLSLATARRIDDEQRWQHVRNTSAIALPEVQNNRAVQDLQSELARTETLLAQEKERHTEAHPAVRELQAQVGELNTQIGGLAENIRQSFYERYAASAQQERRLNQEMESMRASAMAERERGVQFNSLAREVDTNKVFYDGLLQRYREIAAASGAPSANVLLVDRAQASLKPSSPNVRQNLALSAILGLIAAMMAGFLREKGNDVVRTAEDLEAAAGVPMVGVVPETAKGKSMVDELADPFSPQSEAHNSLAIALQQMNGGELPRSVLVTSSVSREGKSSTSFALARSISAQGHKVLLVDGDLRHPSIASFVAGVPDEGLANLLEAGATDDDRLIVQPDGEEFAVMGAGTLVGAPVKALALKKSKPLIEALAAKADIVIVDGPPLLGLADAVMLSECTEAVLLIVEANWIEKDHLAAAVSRLPAYAKIGGVLTKFDAKSAGVRYGDNAHYSY